MRLKYSLRVRGDTMPQTYTANVFGWIIEYINTGVKGINSLSTPFMCISSSVLGKMINSIPFQVVHTLLQNIYIVVGDERQFHSGAISTLRC